MSHDLKPGDRVRLTVLQRMRDYQPGDQGVVVRELVAVRSTRYYLVAMDQDDPGTIGVVFTDEEIELAREAQAAP